MMMTYFHFKFIIKCVKCYYKVRWSVIKKCDSFFIRKCDNFITKCVDYYQVQQKNVRVSGIWNQWASSPPRSVARVLTSYMTIKCFLSLWWKGDTLPICHRRPIIHPYQLTQHHWKKITFNGAASCTKPSESENVQWHYLWTGETSLHRKGDTSKPL